MLRAIGLALALLSAAAPAAGQRTTDEMLELPSAEVKRLLRSDLNSILAVPGELSRGNLRQIRDAVIPTRPVGSGIPGLCQRDLLLLFYAPTRTPRAEPPERRGLGGEPGRERLEEVPVRPYGVEAERRYFFTRIPSQESLDENRRFRSIFSEDCSASAGSIWEGWFTAPSREDAVGGFLALRAAAGAVESDRVPISGCEEDGPEAIEQCRVSLAQLAADPNTLNAIKTCPTETGRLCYAIDGAGMVITVVARLSGKALTADDVVSVGYEAYIIVT